MMVYLFLQYQISNTPSGAHLTATLTEPLFMSPFNWAFSNVAGITGVSTFQTLITLVSDLSRMWSHYDLAISGYSFMKPVITITGARLLLRQNTLPLSVPVPNLLNIQYLEIIPYITTMGGPLAPTASTTITANSIQLSVVPNELFIFARQQNSDRSYLTSDTFAQINSVVITYNNKVGILSSATSQSIYQIAAQNGVNYSWAEWNSNIGSVLKLKFGCDVPLNSDTCSGMLMNQQLQVTVNITNINPNPITYSLYLCTVNCGVLTISQQLITKQIGVISALDVANAQPSHLTYDHPRTMLGGSWVDDIWSILKLAPRTLLEGYNFAKPILDIFPHTKKYTQAIDPYVPLVRATSDLLQPEQNNGQTQFIELNRFT